MTRSSVEFEIGRRKLTMQSTFSVLTMKCQSLLYSGEQAPASVS